MLPMLSARNLLLLAWALCVPTAMCQSVMNPAFWQSPRTYNASGAMAQDSSRTLVALSYDFQTVYPGNDSPVSPRRLVFDYSYACKSTNTTFDSLQRLNNNNMRYGTIPNVPVIALIERGYCNWSEKLDVALSVAASNNLNLSAVLFFDNFTKPSAEYRLYAEDSLTTFVAGDQLPDSRNITQMPDNDLASRESLSIPVYWAPKTYGDQFKRYIAESNTTGSEREFWQISSILAPFGDRGSSDGSPFSRGYLSYIIALAAIFLVALFAGVVFLRWWRVRQLREQMEYEAQLSAHAYTMQLRMQAKPLPVDIVNSIPISRYTAETVKNTNCAICLEDYVQDVNEVRILGCGHGFCVLCIDPWLTQKSTMCPICKWDCLPEELRNQEADPEATLPVVQPNSAPAPHVAVVMGDPVAESSASASRAITHASTLTLATASSPPPADESTKETDAKATDTKATESTRATGSQATEDTKNAHNKEAEAEAKKTDANADDIQTGEPKDDAIDDAKASAATANNNNSATAAANQSDTEDRRGSSEHVTTPPTPQGESSKRTS